jgi:hypothetical protein
MSEHDDCNRFGPVNCLVKNCMDLCVDCCSRHASSGSCVFPPILFRRICFFHRADFITNLRHMFLCWISPPQDEANNSDSEIGAVFGVVVGVVCWREIGATFGLWCLGCFCCYLWGRSCGAISGQDQ